MGMYVTSEEDKKMMTTSGVPVFNRAVDLIQYGAALRGYTTAQLLRRDRTRALAFTRFGIIWVMRWDMGLSLPRIAKEMNFRDHTTVIHALERANELFAELKWFDAFVDELRAYVKGQRAAGRQVEETIIAQTMADKAA